MCSSDLTVMKNIETIQNRWGELQTKWTSHKHPTNPNFMQVVKYMHIQRPDGRQSLHWRLFNSSANDKYVIWNITLEDAIQKFTDSEEDIMGA